jgi:hypothetical protein
MNTNLIQFLIFELTSRKSIRKINYQSPLIYHNMLSVLLAVIGAFSKNPKAKYNILNDCIKGLLTNKFLFTYFKSAIFSSLLLSSGLWGQDINGGDSALNPNSMCLI